MNNQHRWGLVVADQFFSQFFQVQGLQHGYEGGTSALNKLVESIAKRMEVCGFGNVPSFPLGLRNENMVGWLSKEKDTEGGSQLEFAIWRNSMSVVFEMEVGNTYGKF